MSEELTAQNLVKKLLEADGMSPQKISEAMGERVSSRTIYRWAKGESAPQQKSDYDALLDFYNQIFSAA